MLEEQNTLGVDIQTLLKTVVKNKASDYSIIFGTTK